MLTTIDVVTALPTTPADALRAVDARIERLTELAGPNPNGTPPHGAASMDLVRSQMVRETYQVQADRETIDSWLYHQRQLKIHRGLAAEHAAVLKAMGREYAAAVKRAQARWDLEH